MAGKRENFETIQAGRGLAAIAVLLYHGSTTLALPKYFGQEASPIFRAADSGVQFFFVLSGMIMVLAHGAELGHRNSPWPFLWKRCRRIYPPLWATLTVVLAALIIVPALAPGSLPSASTILHAYLVTPVHQYERLLAVEWTLRHEIMFYGLFAITIWRPRFGGVLLVGWFAGSLVTAALRPDNALGHLFDPVHLLFLMGMAAAYMSQRSRISCPWVIFASGTLLFAMVWMFMVEGRIHFLPFKHWGYGLGATAMLMAAVELEKRDALRPAALLVFLGEASYSIYLVHFLAISVLAKFAVKIDAMLHLPVWAWFAATAVGATAIGVGFYVMVEKPLLQMTRRGAFRRPAVA